VATDDQAQVTTTELLRAKGARELQLTDRGLTALPPEVTQLTHLQTLRLRDNQLTSLPPELGQLTDLQVLDLRGNQLTSLPPELGQLTKLHTLHLGANQFTSLPPEIAQLPNLELLDFGHNQFTSLPPEIGEITNLRVLYLHENRLTGLPPEITQLTSLDTLDLSGNQLTSLPPEITRLTNLQELYLSGNQLTDLPPEITGLIKLHTLRLFENRLTDLPLEITQLPNLELLDLGGNQLTSLPPEISQLTSLRVLHLGDNQLTSLRPEITQLPDLQELHLDRNQLTTLPPELAEPLAHGLVLGLVGNPLHEPLPELVERGADALASYLRSLKDAIPHYEAKVLLVGEGNVGKTSLVGALLDDPFVPGRPTTHGVEIRPLTLPHPNQDVVMKVRTWDFGGQEVYRITHQFFFSPRALYLVVWNAREGQEQNEVEGWLRRIRVRVGHDTPTLVVATHCDERNPELDYPGLQRTFQGMLVGRHEVDNFSRNGIPELRNAIAEHAARLPQMGQPFSPRWIAARDEILARAKTEPQISYEEFVAVCQRHQIPGDEITTLAGLLHDLGLIIYYGDDEGLRDIVVLNPEWLTKAISYVLEDKPTREDRGVLDHSRLKEIWQERQNGAGYPARYYPYFLRLMEKFDVSYRLADDEHTKEKAERWTRWMAFAQVRHGSNIQLLLFSLVRAWSPSWYPPSAQSCHGMTARHHPRETGAASGPHSMLWVPGGASPPPAPTLRTSFLRLARASAGHGSLGL
jgi:Leucine-rich repeat (LRR) protein